MHSFIFQDVKSGIRAITLQSNGSNFPEGGNWRLIEEKYLSKTERSHQWIPFDDLQKGNFYTYRHNHFLIEGMSSLDEPALSSRR